MVDYNKFQHIVTVWKNGDYEQAGLEASAVIYADPDEPDEETRTRFISEAPGIEGYIKPENKPGKADKDGNIHDEPVINQERSTSGQNAPMPKDRAGHDDKGSAKK